MLPGTINAADRYVRVSYLLNSSPKFEGRMAVASVFSIMRAIGVPLGMEDPDHPNISATLWRSVSDHAARRYYFESTLQPAVFWVDLANLDLSEGAGPMSVKVDGPDMLAGEISGALKPSEAFNWMWP
jgi:choloylglycine hydrolase